MTYPNGRQIAYGYGASGSVSDPEGLVASVADANSFGDNTLASYSYLGDGTLVGESHPQTGANEAITLDNFGNVADLNWTNASSASTDHFGYGYDADGNVLYKQNYVLPGDGELYHASGAGNGYDGLNRLTSFSRGTLSASGSTLDTIASPSKTQTWTLDALGNQTAVTTNGVTQSKTPNLQNQTTAVTTGSVTNALGYDANGNTKVDEYGRQRTYDAWGDLVSVATPSGRLIEHDSFDALGRRISITTPTATTDFYYSTSGQVIEEDQSGSVIGQTVYGPSYVNDVIERDQATGSPGTLNQRVYFQQDANHNVTSLTDTSGNVLERYTYDPYGNVTVLNADWSLKGDGTIASSSYKVPNLFQGMRYDAATGNYTTPNRDYDPILGTWMEEDPAGSGANLYQLETGSPADSTDPYGRCFAAGTLVLMADGSRKAIETVVPREDRTWSPPDYDAEGPAKECRVLEVYHNAPARILHVHARGQIIRTTFNHPFYVRGKGWTAAEKLMPGDKLRTHKGIWVPVDAIEDSGRVEPVFNLHVEASRTYFVAAGEAGQAVLVHNQSAGTAAPPSGPPAMESCPGAPTLAQLEAMYAGKGVQLSRQAQPRLDNTGNPRWRRTLRSVSR